MKKYEIVVSVLQLALFYIYPIIVRSEDPMGMVLLIIIGTFILSLIMGCLSKNKIKYFYSIFTAIIFIPSVFIYYNESALIHAIWYLFVASIGIMIGSIIKSRRKYELK